jgi:hypothetical protein
MINETLEQNQNSIELALTNFLLYRYNIKEELDDGFKKLLGVEITSVMDFSDYLELSYALDKFDAEVPTDPKSAEGEKIIIDLLGKYNQEIVANLEEQKEENPKFKTRKDLISNLVQSLQGVQESFTIGIFVNDSAKELNESFNYSTVIPEDVYESVKKWLESESIPFSIGEDNELVVECGDRETVYHVDRFLTRTLNGRNTVMDRNIYMEYGESQSAEPHSSKHETVGDYVEELNNMVSNEDLEKFDDILAKVYAFAGVTFDEMNIRDLVNSLNERDKQSLLDDLHSLSYDYALDESAKDNFTIDDIKELEVMTDLQVAKEKAMKMVQGTDTSAKITPAKKQYFMRKINSARTVFQLVDMFYQMLLSGEGHGRIGTKSGMGKSSYRQAYEAEMSEAKKKPQDMTTYDLAKMGKPRMDPTKQPKAGAFSKDTKAMMQRKDPHGRKTMKHKGQMFESKSLKEHVLGMTQMPTIMRMRALAGLEDNVAIKENDAEFSDAAMNMIPEQTEAYMAILDHLAAIQNLLPGISMAEYKEFIASIEAMTDEFEL